MRGGAFAALDDQAVVEQALDYAVERAGAELYFAARAKFDLFEDGVAVKVITGEGEHDVEHGRGQRCGGFGSGRFWRHRVVGSNPFSGIYVASHYIVSRHSVKFLFSGAAYRSEASLISASRGFPSARKHVSLPMTT